LLIKNDKELEALLSEVHHADIAEILDELDFDEATYIFKVLDSDKTAEILELRMICARIY
jgi:magnesium transporter